MRNKRSPTEPAVALTVAAMVTALASRGCSLGFDSYDPRLGSGSGGAPSGSTTLGTGSESTSSSTSTSDTSSTGSTSMFCMPGTTQPCYTGPPGTETHLPCSPGIQVCNAEGTLWGPCKNEVLPTLEDCSTPTDDDCSGVPNEHCATWSTCFGDSADQYPYALAVAPDGRMVVAGEMYGAINLGNESASAPGGGGDIFVASLHAAQGTSWVRAFGNTGEQWATGAAIDGAGNVILTGAFDGNLHFGASPALQLTSAGKNDIFVAKLDPLGTPLWALRFGGLQDDFGYDVATDAMGNVYVAASFSGVADFGSGFVSAKSEDGVVLKLDPGGNVLWSLPISGSDRVISLTVDATGNPLVIGEFSSTLELGGSWPTAGEQDIFLGKLTSAGTPMWVKTFGSSDADYAGNAVIDAAGHVVFGAFSGGQKFGCGMLPVANSVGMFVTKLDGAGDCVWSNGYASTSAELWIYRVAVDAAGNVYFIAELDGTTDFGVGPLTVSSLHDLLLLALDSQGALRYVRLFDHGYDEDTRGIGVDAAGNVYIVAEVPNGIDLGNGLISGGGADDVCLARFAP